MENRKATEAGQDITMQKEDFAALWKTIHLKVTDTYEVSVTFRRMVFQRVAKSSFVMAMPCPISSFFLFSIAIISLEDD